jgi:hypothetical protein
LAWRSSCCIAAVRALERKRLSNLYWRPLAPRRFFLISVTAQPWGASGARMSSPWMGVCTDTPQRRIFITRKRSSEDEIQGHDSAGDHGDR